MEKMIKQTLLLLSLVTMIYNKTMAQDNEIIRAGLIRAQMTISPSTLLVEEGSFFYLHGNLEGYVSEKVSISGDTYFYLGKLSENNSPFEYNHKLFFGANWHFTNGNSDLYVGVQPGISVTKLNIITPLLVESGANVGVNPLFSSVIGYHYYVNNYFHFFAQSRIILGQHHHDVVVNISEWTFSAGLGFNINSIKK